MLWFHSHMVLWPGENLGLFVSTNTASTGRDVEDTLVAAVSQELGFRELNTEWQLFDRNMVIYADNYISVRRSITDYTKILGLAGVSRIDIDEISEELVASFVRRYKPIADDVFQRIDGTERLVFRRAGDEVVGYSTSEAPVLSYTRATFSRHRSSMRCWLVCGHYCLGLRS